MSKAGGNRHDHATRCKTNVIHNPDDCEARNASVISDVPEVIGICATMATVRPGAADHRAKLSAAQLSYTANDPRWPEHRRKLAAAQVGRQRTLRRDQVQTIIEMRGKGRTLRDIANQLRVAMAVLRRGMSENGIPTTGTLSRKIALSPDQIRAIQSLRKTGRTLEDIAELMCLSRQVITRELRSLGVPTDRVRTKRIAQRRSNAWHSVLDLDGGRAWA